MQKHYNLTQEQSELVTYCLTGNIYEIKIFINNEGDIHFHDEYLLYSSIIMGCLDVVKFLIEECNCNFNSDYNSDIGILNYIYLDEMFSGCTNKKLIIYLMKKLEKYKKILSIQPNCSGSIEVIK